MTVSVEAVRPLAKGIRLANLIREYRCWVGYGCWGLSYMYLLFHHVELLDAPCNGVMGIAVFF